MRYYYYYYYYYYVGRDSVVGIETHYGLECPGIESPGGGGVARFFAAVHTGPAAHTASYTMGT